MKINSAKWAVITGASSGIGRATALLLGQSHYNLCLISRRSDKLMEVASEVQSLKDKEVSFEKSGQLVKRHHEEGQVKVFSFDLRNRAELLNFVSENGGSILKNTEVLVNAAGLAKGVEKFQDGRYADWEEMMQTNVMAMLGLTREVIPFMVQRKQGHIFNIGSVAGRWVYPGGSVYCASKFAVRAISEGLRMDLLGTGIRVTNIEPGMVETEFSKVRLGDQNLADAVYKGMTPLYARDIADSIQWCLERPSSVNIQELVIFPTDQAAVGQVYRR